MIDSHIHLDLYEQADIDNMMREGNGYFVSFTPDIVYEAEIRELAKIVPIDRVMVETDGPWPFKSKFLGQKTHPGMIRSVIQELAALKALSFAETDAIVLANTEKFYGKR